MGVLSLAYAEHAYNWKKAGHDIIELTESTINDAVHKLDVLILINPNNPTAQRFTKSQLFDWHKQLQLRNGWLIIDEAFIDSTPENSLSSYPVTDGLIILRSIGKFFGLAGIRCGFVIASEAIIKHLNQLLGPWTISHPSRYIAAAALLDINWQQNTQLELTKQSNRLALLLHNSGLKISSQTDLFVWVQTKSAKQIHQFLAQQGILTRLFNKPQSLRFGLPKTESQWLYLSKFLHDYCFSVA